MKNKRIAAVVASLGLAAMAYTAVPVNAGAEDYETINGGTISFEKYLVMENDAIVPNVSFEFSVAPITADIPATDTTPLIKKGPNGIKFTAAEGSDITVDSTNNAATVQFKPSDTTNPENTKTSDQTITFSTSTNKEDEKFASKAITLDLTDVSFTQPGIYRYVINETNAGKVAGVSPDSDSKRNLDMYVEVDSLTGKLKVEGFVMYDSSDNKSSGFTNLYSTENLTITKNVAGNQGSKNKHFKFNVQLTNKDDLEINDNNVFTISGNIERAPAANDGTLYGADTMNTANKVTTLTYGELKEGHDFYLCSGSNVEIIGIPSGLGYKITEYPEDYSPSISYDTGSDNKTNDGTDDEAEIAGAPGESSDPKTYSVSDSCIKADTSVIFTNEKAGTLPTGVLMTVAGSAAIAALGIAGVAAGTVYLRKKKSEEE